MRYKTKRKTVDAWKIDYDDNNNLKCAPKWLIPLLYYNIVTFESKKLFVKTEFGNDPTQEASKGDYIILRENGKLDIMNKEVSEDTYEEEQNITLR